MNGFSEGISPLEMVRGEFSNSWGWTSNNLSIDDWMYDWSGVKTWSCFPKSAVAIN